MEVVVRMHREDLRAFISVNQHPFTVQSTASTDRWQTRKRSTLKAHRQRILAYVKDNPGCTTTDLCQNPVGRRYNISVVVKEMVRAGELKKEGSGRNGSPYQYFLPETDMQSVQSRY